MSTEPYVSLQGQGSGSDGGGEGRDALIPPQAHEQQPNNSQRDKMDKIQVELDQTKQVLHKNIEQIVERGERVDHLQARTRYIEELSYTSKQFNQTARKTNRKMWLKNMKWAILICLLVVVILAGIIGGAVKGSQ